MEQQLAPLAMAMQAIANTPLCKGVYHGVAELQRHHHRAFGAERPRVRQAPAVVMMPRAKELLHSGPFAAILPESVGSTVLTAGLLNFLQLYNSALVVRLVLTWFPNPPAFIEQPLATVTDPYLGLFRGIIPPLGGTIDLSPILAFVVLNFFTSSAAALPCEMGSDGSPAKASRSSNPFSFMQPTKLAAAWERRMAAQRAARDSAAVTKSA